MADTGGRIPSIWTTGWTDQLKTGTWRNAVAVHRKRQAPCHGACPVGGEIPAWVRQVRERDLRGAWLTLVENNPLPATLGRTCHHPCQAGCNRGEHDGAVSVNALEQYVGDLALREGWELPRPVLQSQERVAVIGGGPAGLSCAYQLRRSGFRVTLYDANPELGGVLRYGIPAYRLPKEILAAEIARIVDLGVEVAAGRRITASDLPLLEREYAAVFVAFGAPLPKRLPQFADKRRVFDGISFLQGVSRGISLLPAQASPLGERVVVIGGGSVAMDVAGCAARLGSKVEIVALEGRDALPATAEELQDALEEGAVLHDGAMVKEVGETAQGITLRCVRVSLDPAAPAGTLRPLEIAGSDFTLQAESVVLAVGQDPELAEWRGILDSDASKVLVDERYMTSRRGVFAAGDLAGSERLVSVAVGDGKRAARAIAAYLGRQLAEEESAPAAEVSFADINTFYFPPKPVEERGKVEARERKGDFREIRVGFADDRALAQAERCFSCGACTECNNCFYFCPDMAIEKDAESPLHYRVLDQYCKGCGCCVAECPRGAVGAREETK